MVKFNKHNASGYPDPTAHDALLPIAQREADDEARTARMIKAIKALIDLSGYELLARIEVRDRASGKVYR